MDVTEETRRVGVYRLNVAPGRGIPLHLHRKMKESELMLGMGLLCQGRAVPRGTVFRWSRNAAHRHDDPSAEWQSILRRAVASPAPAPRPLRQSPSAPACSAAVDRCECLFNCEAVCTCTFTTPGIGRSSNTCCPEPWPDT